MIGFNGDEFIIESYGISWLLWINLLVMFLLIFVLYYFTVFVSDGAVTAEVGQISSAKKYGHQLEFMESKINYCSNKISRSSCSKDIKVYNNQIIGKGNASTSRREIRERQDNQDQIEEMKGCSATTQYNQCSSYNPCYLLELGKRAFLKCLGLDSTATTQDSSAVQQPSSLSSRNKLQEKRNETDKSK